jgi:hypothetical protein
MTDTPTAPTPRPGANSALGLGLMAAALALPAIQPAHAESAPERGTIALKALDYLDSQPGADRIRVRANSLLIQAPVAGEWLLGGTLTSDSISGASPAYHTSALTNMHDKRHAIELSATRYFANASLTVGANVSSESDYLSRGLSVQGSLSSDSKNTTWTAGLGINHDVINPSNQIVDHETKRVTDLLLGVTQVITTHDIAQLNLGHSFGSGYFSDPYKVMDNRPRERNHTTLMARWNHHFEASGGTLRSSWRYYTDSFGVKAHTLGFEYVQPLGQGWTVMPLLRLYTQTAARFYVDADPSTDPFPPNPPADAVYYTEDQRLSAFGARTVGLKVSKQLDADWLVDLKLESYGQRAAWTIGGTGSPGLAPFHARSIQLGVSRQF